MLHSFNKVIAWSLIIALTIIGGAGEGLHCLPGCGHAVRVGNGILLIGVSSADHAPLLHNQAKTKQAGIKGPNSLNIPILDEADCPICSLLAQPFSFTHFAAESMVMPFVHDLPVVPSRVAISSAPNLRLARAPPLA